MNDPHSPEKLQAVDQLWRAANYLSAGQIYLRKNALLERPLALSDVKPRLLGHWGTTPGLNFIYAHLNRAIVAHDLNALFVAGPGHGGPALTANTWLEGSYGELDHNLTRDAAGMEQLFRQFSFPGGVGSHATPEVPGSIHEGGELGYSLSHAYGAAFDNPSLLVACVIGDGEAETGALATAWHSNKFLNPARDGAVLPILHLNGYKIANPCILARLPHQELEDLLNGYGHSVHWVEGDDPSVMHARMAAVLDELVATIRAMQQRAKNGDLRRPPWPMIVLRTPKGWTGPAVVDGKQIEGTWRAHQVPLAEIGANAEHLAQLEAWMRSYRPAELFDSAGRPAASMDAVIPRGERRMGANPHANGGALLQDLQMPAFAQYAVPVETPGNPQAEPTRVLGSFLRDVMRLNPQNFRLFGPDETASNRLSAVFEVTKKTWLGGDDPQDELLSPDGRVMEILSEHTCQGWLEGYLLSGRHGLFSCYEAFIHIVDSMFNQYAKWLKVAKEVPWRKPVASLNYLLTSHVWRQDHNGFSHQDPGFLDVVANKKADIVRIYLPPDANTLLSVADHCLRSRNLVNVIVAGKNMQPQWLDMDAAIAHCKSGVGIWQWASNDAGADPDVVMACAGDIPTIETLAATSILRAELPDLKVRVINVVDLMSLQPPEFHPHGLSSTDFDALFTRDRPIIFNFHGYPWLIHRLSYRRTNHANLHVRGYIEEGTTTTPFDMAVLNRIDRFSLVMDVIQRVPGLSESAAALTQRMQNKHAEHWRYIREHGEDMPEVSEWAWQKPQADMD
ncbi:MAG TPA: phosphoketolase family protein [Burkholderiales bacterium]|nr:phosphoketolase family protein [Burkholderiales bacterium]